MRAEHCKMRSQHTPSETSVTDSEDREIVCQTMTTMVRSHKGYYQETLLKRPRKFASLFSSRNSLTPFFFLIDQVRFRVLIVNTRYIESRTTCWLHSSAQSCHHTPAGGIWLNTRTVHSK